MHEAYTQRSAMHCAAKCYLQARQDAQAAVHVLMQPSCQAQEEQEKDRVEEEGEEGAGPPLAAAYLRLGEACLAERGHVDRDCAAALKAYVKGGDLHPKGVRLREGREEAEGELSGMEVERVSACVGGRGGGGGLVHGPPFSSLGDSIANQVSRTDIHLARAHTHTHTQPSHATLQVLREVYNEGSALGAGLRPPGALGQEEGCQPGAHIFRVELMLAFPQVCVGPQERP